MKLPSFYFSWLQKDNPVGIPDKLPLLRDRFETSVPGLYCVGDLTGIPLIKLAGESGYEAISFLDKSSSFIEEKAKNSDPGTLDVLIAGAGPSGVSAALRCQDLGLRYLIVESSRMFSTIRNFPQHKPIYVTPADTEFFSGLKFTDGTKETLLDQLTAAVSRTTLNVHENETVQLVKKHGAAFLVQTDKASYAALRVLIATGKTGNAKTLSVEGSDLPKVFTRLIDPYAHFGENVLVVGGGNSAAESAVSLAIAGCAVTLSYRRNELFRVTKRNLEAFNVQVGKGTIVPLFNSTVKRIEQKSVTLTMPDSEKTIPNNAVYTMIGAEIPVNFLRRIGIKIQGGKSLLDYCGLAFSLLFSCMVYFGKSVAPADVNSMQQFFRLQMHFVNFQSVMSIETGWAWMGFMGTIILGPALLFVLVLRRQSFITRAWDVFKYAYFFAVVSVFIFIYISYNLCGTMPLGFHPGYWYSFMFSLTIAIFGMRRMYANPTGYIVRQTVALILVQGVFLFVLPLFVLPFLGNHGFLGSWVMNNIFPGRSYWHSFGFVLAWPLMINNLATASASASRHISFFWLILSLVQTFVIIPAIVLLWGKGAYCGWICSCGALAETLGDDYRKKAPHGAAAKRFENFGQIILWFALVVTLWSLLSLWLPAGNPGSQFLVKTYSLMIDILLAGVVGLGSYFFLTGRVWCRFFCPLAALMHIYTRFSRFRIMANKSRCISCNICTQVCHMGIDVMNYANKGIPMNDVQCVRCSACVINCPLQVLTFGGVGAMDFDNSSFRTSPHPLARGWKSGLPQHQIRMLLAEQESRTGRQTLP
jgi:thioredoxin reductase/NAD-dependent dihydropyrimidine dehydrogenase PreA subunit